MFRSEAIEKAYELSLKANKTVYVIYEYTDNDDNGLYSVIESEPTKKQRLNIYAGYLHGKAIL